jgi:hypothetical protein
VAVVWKAERTQFMLDVAFLTMPKAGTATRRSSKPATNMTSSRIRIAREGPIFLLSEIS